MLFSSSYFVTQIKKKKENVSSLRKEQGDRAMMIFIILYTDAGSFIFFASVCLSCPPLPPLPLSLFPSRCWQVLQGCRSSQTSAEVSTAATQPDAIRQWSSAVTDTTIKTTQL